MKFVHIADVHLGMGFKHASFGSQKGIERRREIKGTLLKVVDYCEVNGVDVLLIAGDLFEDDYVAISDLKDLNHSFSQLSHTHVIIGAGNHDPIINGQGYYKEVTWQSCVHILDTSFESVYLEGINTEIWGQSWHQKSLAPFDHGQIHELDSDRINLLMLHGDVYQKNDYHYIDLNSIDAKGFDYVALGHIHKQDFIRSSMAYPGSLEPQDFSETGRHGFIEGQIRDKVLDLKFVDFAQRAFVTRHVTIDGTMAFEGIYDHMLDGLLDVDPNDFVRLVLEGNLDPEVDLDTKALEDRLNQVYYYGEVVNKTHLDLDIDKLADDYEGTFIGRYIESLRAKDLDDPVVNEALEKGLRLLLEKQVKL